MTSPAETILSLAWVVGLITLVSGISTFLNWLKLRRFFPQSGSILFSAIMQVILGIIFLRHDLALASFLNLMFAFFLIIEGVNLAIRSFDYKKVGVRIWWVNFVLGICSAVLGTMSLHAPEVGGATLSSFIGIGFIVVGAFYFVALCSIGKFEKKLNSNPWIDEQ